MGVDRGKQATEAGRESQRLRALERIGRASAKRIQVGGNPMTRAPLHLLHSGGTQRLLVFALDQAQIHSGGQL